MGLFDKIQKRIFPFIIALSAISVSASAAFYSVSGLSKLFAGASNEVLVMAGSLEVAKLVIASLLYQYWPKLNKVLRTYLSIATIVLILITSAGIYGFLSAAYQETSDKSQISEKQIELLELKKERYKENRTFYIEEKKQLDKDITGLRLGLSNNVIQYKDKETGQIITTTSSSTRKAIQLQLDDAIARRDTVSGSIEVMSDSVTSLEIQAINVEKEDNVASELGPLKYISKLTGYSMDKIVNVLLIIIMLVFDPLAVALVISANFAFRNIIGIKKEEESLSPPHIDIVVDDNKKDVIENTDDPIIIENIIEEKKSNIIKEIPIKNKRISYLKRDGS